jgi:hypothetical protein
MELGSLFSCATFVPLQKLGSRLLAGCPLSPAGVTRLTVVCFKDQGLINQGRSGSTRSSRDLAAWTNSHAHRFIDGEAYWKLHGVLFALLFLLAALTSVGYCSDERVEGKAAAYAIVSWLALIDSNRYGESWFQTGSEFRNSLSKERWVNALRSVRAPLGRSNRAQSRCDFYHKAAQKGSQWKLSGYFIKPAGEGR